MGTGQGYVRGWLNYYGHNHSYSQLLKLEQWIELHYPEQSGTE
jgi:hypothetical protein